MKQLLSLHGSYFFNNYGDTLLVNIFANWIQQFSSDVVINLPVVNRRKIKEMPGKDSGLANLCKSKALVYCGGGYFGEQPRHKYQWAVRNFFRHGIVGLLAIQCHIPIAIIGVEFGPISASWFRKIVIYIAKHADLIIVRNQESYDFLVKYGVSNLHISYDAVLSLSDLVAPKRLSVESPTIALHIPFINQYPDQYMDLARFIVRQAKAEFKNFKIYLINDGTYNVYKKQAYKNLRILLESEDVCYEIPEYKGCFDFAELINNCNFVFTTKLHVGITGAALNKRVFSLYTHPKAVRLHKQLGNDYYCEPISGISLDTERKIKEFFRAGDFVLPSYVKDNALINKQSLHEFLQKLSI